MNTINLGSLVFTIEGRNKIDAAVNEAKSKIKEVHQLAEQPVSVGGRWTAVPMRQGTPASSIVGGFSMSGGNHFGTAGRITSIELLSPSTLFGPTTTGTAAWRQSRGITTHVGGQRLLPGGYSGGRSPVPSVFSQYDVLNADARRRALNNAMAGTGAGTENDPVRTTARRVTESHDEVSAASRRYAGELTAAAERLRRQGNGSPWEIPGRPYNGGGGNGTLPPRYHDLATPGPGGGGRRGGGDMSTDVPLKSSMSQETVGQFAHRMANKQVMSSSMMMMAMFGGFEAFGAVNAYRGAQRIERQYGSADRRTAEGYLAAAEKISGGIIGTPLSFALDPILEQYGLTPEQTRGKLESADTTDRRTQLNDAVRDMERAMRRQQTVDGLTGYSSRVADVFADREQRQAANSAVMKAIQTNDDEALKQYSADRRSTFDNRLRERLESEGGWAPTPGQQDTRDRIQREMEAAEREDEYQFKEEQLRLRERTQARLDAASNAIDRQRLDRIGGDVMRDAGIFNADAEATAASRQGRSYDAFRANARAHQYQLESRQQQDRDAYASSIESLPFPMRAVASGAFMRAQGEQRRQLHHEQAMDYGQQFVAPRLQGLIQNASSYFGMAESFRGDNAVLDARLARNPLAARLAEIDAQRRGADSSIDASSMPAVVKWLAKQGNASVFGKQAQLAERGFADARTSLGIEMDGREAQFAARNDSRRSSAIGFGYGAIAEAEQLRQSGQGDIAARSLRLAQRQINAMVTPTYEAGAFDRNIAASAQRGPDNRDAITRTNDLLARIETMIKAIEGSVAGGTP